MDVYLRIVGGFEAGKIVPEESTSNDQNNETRQEISNVCRSASSDKPKLTGQLRRRCPLVRFALTVLLAVDSLLDFVQTYSISPQIF